MADRDKDKEGQVSGYFKTNGLEHFTFNSKTVISWGVLSGLIGLFVASISVFQSFGTNVDDRIIKHPTIIEMNINMRNTQEAVKEIQGEQKSIICQINKGKNCK